MFPYLIYSSLLYALLGILLGLPNFLKENSKLGSWSFQIEKLIFVGIPVLYIAFYPVINFKTRILTLPSDISSLIMSTDLYFLSALLFGYILITAIERKSIEKQDIQIHV